MNDNANTTNTDENTSKTSILMSDVKTDKDPLLTIPELLELFPYAVQIGWAEPEIEFWFEDGTLQAKRDENGTLRVNPSSFKALLDHHKKVNKHH